MGWVIFVIVVLAVSSSFANKAKRRQAQRGMPMAQFPPQGLSGQPMPQHMPPGPFPPGNPPSYAPVGLVEFTPQVAAPPPQQEPVVAGVPTAPPPRQNPRRRSQPPPPTATPVVRYQGSTALGGTALTTTLATPYQPSSLMSSLTSSLSSSSTDSAPMMGSTSVFREVREIALPDGIATQVRFHLRNGHEVEAVRLVCDQLDVGLLEATKTVRSYGDGNRS